MIRLAKLAHISCLQEYFMVYKLREIRQNDELVKSRLHHIFIRLITAFNSQDVQVNTQI